MDVPQKLEQAIEDDPEAQKAFNKLCPSHKREYVQCF